MLRRYTDLLAYSYDDIKAFQPKEMQHFIPLKSGIKPFKKKQRKYNPKIADTIFQEIQKLLKARIILPIHHSTWIANIVPVRKKNGEIRIFVDFRNLNQASLKDNYPLPMMDQ
ncbi:hypothetical protein KI387_014973, partial [Taxus chinensis]